MVTEAASAKLIIPWIENACCRGIYPDLLKWVDESQKIFFISWIHKASEKWDKSKSKVFKDWAAYKKKLGEKEDRDLKAAFRNALRSKKNTLRLIKKEKDYRLWQITSDSDTPKAKKSKTTKNVKPKQKRGTRKYTRSCKPKNSSADPPEDKPSSHTIVYSTRQNTSAVSELKPLPPCQTLFNVSPPPTFQTTVGFSNTLDGQSEFFCAQRNIEVPTLAATASDDFTVLSPNIDSNLMASSNSPVQNVYISGTDSILTQEALTCFVNFSTDITSMEFQEFNEEQVVPEQSEENLWNYVFYKDWPATKKVNQVIPTQKKTEILWPNQPHLETSFGCLENFTSFTELLNDQCQLLNRDVFTSSF